MVMSLEAIPAAVVELGASVPGQSAVRTHPYRAWHFESHDRAAASHDLAVVKLAVMECEIVVARLRYFQASDWSSDQTPAWASAALVVWEAFVESVGSEIVAGGQSGGLKRPAGGKAPLVPGVVKAGCVGLLLGV